MPCRPVIPEGKVPVPTEGDWPALIRWVRWINQAHAVNQQGVIETVDGDCQFLDVNPLRAQSVGQTSIIRASVPPDQRGASPCPYVEGAIVIFAPVLGGTDQGHSSAIMEPSAETPFLVTTACCVELIPKTLSVTAVVTGGSPVGDCADISPQDLEYDVANDWWAGSHPVLAERNAGNNVTLRCTMGTWDLAPCPAALATCDPFEVTAAACTNVVCSATYDLIVTAPS